MCNKEDETAEARLVGGWIYAITHTSTVTECHSCWNNHVGIIYCGVFTGMEDYSKMTRLWGVRSIHDTPVLDDGFTNRG